MVAAPILRLKQGSTLALDLFLGDDLGGATDLSGLTVNVVVCDPLGAAVATMPLTLSATPGWGTVSAATAGWPVGALNAEVTVASGGGVIAISDSFSIIVERTVAQ